MKIILSRFGHAHAKVRKRWIGKNLLIILLKYIKEFRLSTRSSITQKSNDFGYHSIFYLNNFFDEIVNNNLVSGINEQLRKIIQSFQHSL